ncbi:MAG: 2-oxoacid:acceptor oxidoreductase family protein, partial [Methanobrevibacter sp.]|nr:2-oxoacid:acceptor oxidoreductase family protein [Methanobrevibacter sp.]
TTDVEDVRDFIDQHNIKVYEAPATKTANDEIGLKIVANIVMVGVITKITGIISENAAVEAIKDSVPAGTEEKNIKAFEAGYNLV